MTHDQEDLLRLLDISPDESDEMAADLEFFDNEEVLESAELSETVLLQDEWDRRKGEQLHKQHFTSEERFDPDTVSDFHSMFFHLSPTPAGQCVSKRRQQFMDTMMDSPEYKQLHQSTRQNLLASEMAAVRVARQFQELLTKDQKNPPQASPQPDGNCLAAVAKGLGEAQDEVDAVEEAQAGLGQASGLGQGEAAQAANLDKIRETYQRIRNNRQIKDIFERAGAYRRAAKAIQQSKTKHGYDDMVGFELSGDVARLLPCELALLDDEDLELDVLRRIIERQALTWEYEGVEALNKGPVVVVVDESGSMSGPKIANAKALALAMAWIAKHQKRYCALVGFSGGTEGTRIVLKPGKWDQTKLLDWLGHFYGGGTTLDVPLAELPNKYWKEMDAPKGKTDVILITDAIVHAPKAMVDNFNTWKEKEQVKCISIVLGAAAGDLEKVSNEVHCVPSLTVDGQAAMNCMSI